MAWRLWPWGPHGQTGPAAEPEPLRHIDWFGLLMMVTVGFGWAKPVPVDPGISAGPSRAWP